MILGVGSVAASVSTKIPAKLPGIALGAPALLQVERAAAMFVTYLVVTTVLTRAASGEVPTELRGLKWELQTRDDQTADALEGLLREAENTRRRLARLEDSLDL